MHSLTTSLRKVLQSLRRFSMGLNKPAARWKENQIRSKIQRWLSGPFLEELIRYQIESRDGRWKLQFDFDTAAWQRLVTQRLGLTTSLSKVLQSLRRFSMELNKPAARWKENQIRSKIQRWLSGPFLEEFIRYQIESRDGRWKLQFDFDTAAWQRLVTQRLGRT